ncbi:MAG: FtsX-like permease family protein [Paludibaculum sp.]
MGGAGDVRAQRDDRAGLALWLRFAPSGQSRPVRGGPYTADLRLREFGIRMALGADGRHVRGIVLRHAGKLAAMGAALGLLLAWPAGQTVRSLLFGVGSGDLMSWILAPAVLILVALLSGLGPARRAGRADPAVTLRAE